jgi:hypothetical protein
MRGLEWGRGRGGLHFAMHSGTKLRVVDLSMRPRAKRKRGRR